MEIDKHEYKSVFARGYVAQGLAKARAEDVLLVLDERDIELTDAQRGTVLACSDLDVLARWLRQSVTAATADEALR